MHTFLLMASQNGRDLGPILEEALFVTKHFLPRLDQELRVIRRTIPEIHGGWFYIVPDVETKQELISDALDDETAVLFFGEIYGSYNQDPARVVQATWKTGGTGAVRLLDGCFSCVIIDRKSHHIHVCSDTMGQRSLRYFSDGHHVAVSTHDIPIIATGMCPAEFNLVSAASIVAHDWSLGGTSLIQGISVCNPHGELTFEDGRTVLKRKPLVSCKDRTPTMTKAALREQIHLMIENMIQNTAWFCGDEETVHMDLTAGMDTRVVLALALSVIDKRRVLAFTAGDKDSYEVKTAKLLSRMYKFDHTYEHHENIDAKSFLEHCRLRAFLLNGDTNGKRAADPLPRYDETPRLFGNGGEIYRGYYYPAAYGKRFLLKLTLPEVMEILAKKYNLDKYPWVSNELPENIGRLRKQLVEDLIGLSQCGSDVLDLFYVYERNGRWGSLVARSTWQPRRFSPFNSPGLLRLGVMLPAPIPNDMALQKSVVKNHLPASYYVPINETMFLPLTGYSFPMGLLSKLVGYPMYYLRRIHFHVMGKRQTGRSNDQIRAEIFSFLLNDWLGDMLLQESSVSSRIFQKAALEKMVEAHGRRDMNYLEILGRLTTMEVYRQLVNDVTQLIAKRATTGSLSTN